ncbi:MAG: DHA2 family efflux MFS transporter permease subunit [Parvularculaceae bacterium]|nr:DHA2 family efflux MFS transporter permease subunit [Caulobacterales bacterium]HRX38190.1 DHA2 family efflux MFS transporter permease subunit [Parvularculaceae bacterium]
MSATTDALSGPGAAAPSASAAAPEEKIDMGKLAVFAVMTVGMFMAILDIQIVAASLPTIQAGLAASAEQISWVQTAYLIAEVIMIPASGYLSRALSTRVIFCISSAGFTLASIGCAMAWNIESLVVMRALQGFIGGAMIPTVFATAFSAFPRSKQGQISAGIGLIVTLAPTIGPTVGGYISEFLDWRWLFLVNVIPGALMTMVVWLYADFDKPDLSMLRRLDFLGFALMAIALGLAEYILEEGPGDDWFQEPSITLFTIISLGSLAWFVRRSLRIENRLVDLTAYTNRNFLFGTLATAGMGIVLFGLVYILPLFLARVRGYNSLQIGETLLVTGLSMFLTAPLAAISSRKVDPRFVASFGFLLAGGSTYALSHMTSEWGYWQLFWPQVARGSGMMLAMAPLNVISLGTLTPLQVRNAAGLYNLTRNLGGAFGLAVINTALTDRTAYHARVLSDHLDMGRAVVSERISNISALLAAKGSPAPEAGAVKMLASIVEREAATLAFADCMRLIFLACMVAAVLMLFANPPKPAPVGAH